MRMDFDEPVWTSGWGINGDKIWFNELDGLTVSEILTAGIKALRPSVSQIAAQRVARSYAGLVSYDRKIAQEVWDELQTLKLDRLHETKQAV